MIFEAFIGHKLVDQQPLDPSLSIYRAISNEFYKICVLNNSEKLNFCLPLFMTLKTKEKKLYSQDHYRNNWAASDQPSYHSINFMYKRKKNCILKEDKLASYTGMSRLLGMTFKPLEKCIRSRIHS